MFNVPQFIDIEDKIVGPLTAKQLGWLAIEGVILLFAWSMFDMSMFIIIAIVLSVIFGGLAFYKPQGQPMIMLLLSAFSFFTKPKMYVWHRVANTKEFALATKAKKGSKNATPAKKEISSQKIEDISKLLDHNH